jgi:hypothetical protein
MEGFIFNTISCEEMGQLLMYELHRLRFSHAVKASKKGFEHWL